MAEPCKLLVFNAVSVEFLSVLLDPGNGDGGAGGLE